MSSVADLRANSSARSSSRFIYFRKSGITMLQNVKATPTHILISTSVIVPNGVGRALKRGMDVLWQLGAPRAVVTCVFRDCRGH